MIAFAPYYEKTFLLIVMLLTVSQFSVLQRWNGYTVLSYRLDYKPLVVFSVFFILLYGFRPIYFVFGDTVMYARTYDMMRNFGIYNLQGEIDADWLFYTFMYLSAQVISVRSFLAICMLFYIGMMFAGCRKIDSRHGALLMLFCYGSFEFYPFAVNGVRNGMACSFVIMALACLCRKERVWAIALSFIAIGIHKSTALPVAAMFMTYYISKPKFMYIVWLCFVVISAVIGGYIDSLLSSMGFDERLAYNLQNNDADGIVLEHRFRWDFLLYSSMPILLGWYAIFKRNLYNSTYMILLGTYIYSNAVWVLAIRAMFSSRIAYLSWFLYPIVLAYPLLNFPVFKKQHTQKTAWILLGHFGFTILLWLIG